MSLQLSPLPSGKKSTGLGVSVPRFGASLPDEAVVHVVSKGVGCSGTLITNSLVLTAHHCVVERSTEGEILEKDLPANALEVELGGDYLPWGTVKVRALVTPSCGYQGGNGDIAILVLSRKLVGLGMMRARLTDPPRLGEASIRLASEGVPVE